MILPTLHEHYQGLVVTWSFTDHLVMVHLPSRF